MFIDMELRFSPTAPIDPIAPLKNVTYTEDCDDFICDLTDVQIVPGKVADFTLKHREAVLQ